MAIVNKLSFDFKVPPYGMRNNFIPRCREDFGDGGAFPEVHFPQYPLEMGLYEDTSNALAVHNNADEDSKTDMILRQGHSKDRVIFGRPGDIKEKEMTYSAKITEEELEERQQEVNASFYQQLEKQIFDNKVVKKTLPKLKTDFVLYTPAQNGPLYNGGNQQRIIKMIDVQVDPMEPPRFQINKKIPKGPPSPPPAILSSPPRAPTKREKAQWKIPPCVSNWKNPRGYTVPLANRVAADGRNYNEVVLNEKHNALSEALFIAERKAREYMDQLNMLKRRTAEKAKDVRDEELRQIALKARDRTRQMGKHEEESMEARERDEIRHDRNKQRNRERNLNRAGGEIRKNALEDRDISEKIALGQANPILNRHKDDAMYDRRLMGTTGGLESGFSGGADDMYNVYDKPLFNHNKSIYKAPRNTDTSALESLETYEKGKKFVSEKELRDAPVAYEKDDIFGLDGFLTEVKGTTKRPADDVAKKEAGAPRDAKRRKK